MNNMAHRYANAASNDRVVPAEDSSRPLTGFRPFRVSIGLPVYNGEEYLASAINSLLAQTMDDFELIISDNGSTDATREICEEFVRGDRRISYHRSDRNLGAAANYNKAVDLAHGALFAWANHDDIYAPTYLERCVAELDRCPETVLAYTRSAKIDAAGTVVAPLMSGLGLDDPSPARRLRHYHELSHEIDRRAGWGEHDIEGLWIPAYGVIRTDILRKTGRIGPYISSDTVLIEELLTLGAFAEVEEQLFYKRDHSGRSMRACMAYDKRYEWFAGWRGNRFLFPRWRLLGERLRATLRAPVPVSRKMACLAEMLAYYVRRPSESRGLVREILVNGRRLAGDAIGGAWALERW